MREVEGGAKHLSVLHTKEKSSDAWGRGGRERERERERGARGKQNLKRTTEKCKNRNSSLTVSPSLSLSPRLSLSMYTPHV